MRKTFVLFLAIIGFALSACGLQNSDSVEGLSVLTTTSIVNDVVTNVAGKLISVDSLLPEGSDPHSFSPTPQDLAKLADADLIFANGAGLELFLEDMIVNAGAEEKVVYLSDSLALIEINHEEEEDHDEHEDEHADEHDHGEFDPHTWTDPNNVMVWSELIAKELGNLDSENATIYKDNANSYINELVQLDDWIKDEVNKVPEADRKLITDHLIFGYFGDTYGFEQIGSVYSSASTLSEPSAQELAALENVIEDEGVHAIFVGNTVSPALSKRIGDDTGATIYFLYTGSLSGADGEAGTYINYIKYNVNTIVDALTK